MKYFTKIIASLLLLAIMPMTSAYCFQGVLSTVVKVNIAQAASVDSIVVEGIDACGQVVSHHVTRSAKNTTTKNSILPCCVGSGHAGELSIIQAFETVDVAPIIVTYNNFLPVQLYGEVVYHSPLLSPPDLVMIKKTIIRV